MTSFITALAPVFLQFQEDRVTRYKVVEPNPISFRKELFPRLTQANHPVPNMEYWLGFDPKYLAKSGMMKAVTSRYPFGWQAL